MFINKNNNNIYNKSLMDNSEDINVEIDSVVKISLPED